LYYSSGKVIGVLMHNLIEVGFQSANVSRLSSSWGWSSCGFTRRADRGAAAGRWA
jgi:hypothetical protein